MKKWFVIICVLSAIIGITFAAKTYSEVVKRATVKVVSRQTVKSTQSKFSSELPYQLNVIYFVPKDKKVLPRYQERISKILLEAKIFFKQNLEKYGYSNSTMWLMTNKNGIVKIIYIKWELNNSEYAYDKKDIVAIKEIEKSEWKQELSLSIMYTNWSKIDKFRIPFTVKNRVADLNFST